MKNIIPGFEDCIKQFNELMKEADLIIKKNKAAQSLGKLGGQATAKKLGSKHFSEAGKLGMAKRWHSEPCTDCGDKTVHKLIDGTYMCFECHQKKRE